MKKSLLFVSLILVSILFISSCAQMSPREELVMGDYGVETTVTHKCCSSHDDGYMCTEERAGECVKGSCAKSNCHTVITH